jgi:hypothetical protein
MSVAVGPTVGVLDRGGKFVAAVEDLSGSFSPDPRGGVIAAFSGRLVGDYDYWCAPGVEVRLTFLAQPKRRRSARLATILDIQAVDGHSISLRGSRPLSVRDVFDGPIKKENA